MFSIGIDIKNIFKGSINAKKKNIWGKCLQFCKFGLSWFQTLWHVQICMYADKKKMDLSANTENEYISNWNILL